MKKNYIMAIVMVFCLVGTVFAADDKDFVGCDSSQVIIGTGLATAPYSVMMQTPFKMAPSLMCEYRGSTGGSDNIIAMVDRKIDAGIV